MQTYDTMFSATVVSRRLPLWTASAQFLRASAHDHPWLAATHRGIMTAPRAPVTSRATATTTAQEYHTARRAVPSRMPSRGKITPHVSYVVQVPKWLEHRALARRALSTHAGATIPVDASSSAAATLASRGLPAVSRLDHLVLTTTDVTRCVEFYTKVLGMELVTFHSATGQQRLGLAFGSQKINIHERGREFEPKAHLPVPGALDLCFLVSTTLDAFIEHVSRVGWPIVEGPVRRTGATSPLRSVYLRDPDLNLIEVSEPIA